MDGMQDTDGTHVILGPSRRFRYWPVSVLFVGAGFWVLWIAGLPDLMGDIGEPYWFARLRAKILIAFVPFLGAILMLFVPFGGPVALLTAIRDLAPHGGFDLKGHRLDIAHWGGEEWRLEPRDAPAP
jgi:hypothetical protein